MPKYLLTASYTAEGAKGVMKDGGTKRKQMAQKVIESVGGKLECIYFAFGKHDVIAIFDAPDHASSLAASMVINSTGAIEAQTTILLTVDEVDQATKKKPNYTPPGH